MFTKRFINVPIKIVSESELTNTTEEWDSTMRINPLEIAAYCDSKGEDEGEQEIDCVTLWLKHGKRILVYLTIKEFEDLLNNH